MKSFFLKLLLLILIATMLAPLVLACSDDEDPPSEEEEEEEEETVVTSEYFALNVDESIDSALVNFNDETFLNLNPEIKESLTEKDGKTVLYCNNGASVKLPEVRSLKYCTSIRFDIYLEAATGVILEISLNNEPKPNGAAAHLINVKLDFTGWKHFDIPSTEISGTGTKDTTAVSVEFSATSQEIFITGIDITTESYSVIAPEGVDINDAAHYTAITENARKTLVGSAEVAESDAFKNSLPSINSACATSFNLYKSYERQYGHGLVRDKLFGITVGKDYFAGPGNTQLYYKHILNMATAWGAIGSEYYHSAEVLEAIKFALDYGYEFYYGASRIQEGVYGNWWEWCIGIPINLIQTLVIIESELTPAKCAHYTEVFDWYVPYPRDKAANKIWMTRMCILSAALRRDAVGICVANLYMNDIFDYIDDYMDEGGFFTDGSFIQHYNYAYTTGYGKNYLIELPEMLYYMSGTRFFPQYDSVNNLYEFVIEGIRPVIYDYNHMRAMSGREASRNESDSSCDYVAGMVILHSFAADEYKAVLEDALAYFMQLFDDSFSRYVPLSHISYTNNLYQELKDKTVDPYEITKVFGMMCRTVHQGPEYGVCLSYSNINVGKYEAINNENYVGWYHGDGMIQIYTDGYSFATDFYSFANPYLMPGVTANSVTRNKTLYYSPMNNASNYAGGVSQGKYGTTGFILDYDAEYGINNGTFNRASDSTIYAKKSYFFFDNEIVCVGSDISDMSNTNVKTTIDNRLWRTSSDTLTLGATAVSSPATVQTQITERAVHFTNMGGYVLLGESNGTLYYKKVTNSFNGANTYYDPVPGTRDFLELYIDHGRGNTTTGAIENNTYFYAYLPEASVDETNAYLANPDVELLSQTSEAHAVIEKTLGIVACNFLCEDEREQEIAVDVSKDRYGEYTGVRSIKTLTPASVMITRNSDGSYSIGVSDPTQDFRNTIVYVEIEGITAVTHADAKVNASVNNGVVSILIDTDNSLGQTFNLTVK